jgi:cation transport protein ChaC
MDPRLTPITPAHVEAVTSRLLATGPGGPLWLFAYGSLIWNRPIDVAEQQEGVAVGWHRSFCLEMPWWRGSPEQPGLMMALDTGGRCRGIVYRLEDGNPQDLIRCLVRREIDALEDMGMARWITVTTSRKSVRALAFYAAPRGLYAVRGLPLETVAWTLARACGPAGSSAAYLYNTVLHLEQHGIRDKNLWRLQQLVAAEIRKIHLDRRG